MRRSKEYKPYHEETEGICVCVASGASFIVTSGDPKDSGLASGDALIGVWPSSALAAGPELGVEGDFCPELAPVVCA